MVLTNSVIRRYTPPTCTLQIVARNSPLPRLKGQAQKKLLQFELRFDDPRLPEERQIHIQGDRNQLEALQEAVTVYTQNLLNQSPERFNDILSALTSPLPTESIEFTPQVPDATTDDFQTASAESRSLNFSDTSAHLASGIAYEDSTTGLFGKIFLQPGRGLSHKLFLGAMATEETGPSIQLSVLQLFDLLTALDEYSADALTIPVLSPSRSAATTSVWASIATVLLVAVGLTAVVLLLNRSNPRQQIAKESNTQGSSSTPQQPVALQPLPATPIPVPITPLPTTALPTLPPPLSSIPSPSTIPFGAVPGTLLPNTTPGANTRATRPAPPTFNTTPSQSGLDSLLREAKGSRTSGPTLNVPVPPTAATLPSPSPDSKTSPSASSTSDQTGSNPTVQQSPNFASTPNPLGIPTPLAPGSTANPLGIPTPSGASGLGLTQTTPSSGSPNSPSESKTSALFDVTPQVTEVREYFKQRWSPPSGLNQALQYSILLDVDGSIQRIIPLGQASINYVDRSSMPGVGKRFVSANKSGQTSRIRVVLFPNGRVQAFPELSNQ